jgi:hypothetical protein
MNEIRWGEGRLPVGAALLIVLAASLAIMPELLWGLSQTDSYHYNLLWTDEFARQFARGDLYPRWLSQSWDGLGAPTFYHYPPLFFWIASLVSVATMGLLSIDMTVSLASWLVLIASGVTAFMWLRRFGARATTLIATVAYMLAPYHLYDLFGRGALAESTSYAVLPLVLIAIDRVSARRRDGPILLAFSYCLLILAHLPSAVLASVSLIPAWIFFRAWREDHGLVLRCAIGIAAGIGLAAFYLVPALTLLRFILTAAFTSRWYDPVNWAFWAPGRWPIAGRAMLNILFSIAALSVAGAALMARQENSDRKSVRFWAGISLLLFLMIGGFIPFFWHLPGLAMVQFPARLLPEAELAAATAFVLARPRLRHPASLAALLIVSVAWTTSAHLMIQRTFGVRSRAVEFETIIFSDRRDDPSYLPAGHPLPIAADGAFGANPSLVKLPDRSWLVRGDATITAVQAGEAIDIRVAAPESATLVARRFGYPRWIVRDERGASVVPATQPITGLVEWTVPAGLHHYRLEPIAAPGERISLLTSATILVLMLTLWGLVLSDVRRFRRYLPLAVKEVG